MYLIDADACAIFKTDIFMFYDVLTDKDLSYDNLALGLKEALQNDKSVFEADRLQNITGKILHPFEIMSFLCIHEENCSLCDTS